MTSTRRTWPTSRPDRGKVTAGVVALVGFLTLWESATADGQINGGDWSALIVSLAATVAAFFGYKLLFSSNAPVNGKDQAR